MKSIQTKIIILSMFVIVFCSCIVGGIGVIHLQEVSDQNSAQIMNLLCREEGEQIDQIFYSVEQSVKIIAHNTVQNMDTTRLRQSEEVRESYIEELENFVLNVADSTDHAMAVYVHFNPEVAPADAGVFYSKSRLGEVFTRQEVTDMSGVSPEEKEDLDWYYKPAEAGKAVWLPPYYNGKSEQEVISYVMPIFREKTLVGVAGMDVLFSDLVEKIANIKVYETGYAVLTDENNTIYYHPLGLEEFEIGKEERWKKYIEQIEPDKEEKQVYEFSDGGKECKLAFCDVDNGMRLMVVVPKEEIDARKNEMVRSVVAAAGCIAVFFMLFCVAVSQSIIAPLKALTETSKEIAAGDLNVVIPTKSKDEVGELARSLQQMVDCLREHMGKIKETAYTDPLTGVKSKAAYEEEVKKINEGIVMGSHQFGIVMFDLNGLKVMNDTYGHDAGDNYIKNSSRLICSVFKHSPIFRIGGDEFAAIIRGEDLAEAEKKLRELYERMEALSKESKKPEDRVSVAAGIAVFDEENDRECQDVFKRADENMYYNKKSMKKGNAVIFTR